MTEYKNILLQSLLPETARAVSNKLQRVSLSQRQHLVEAGTAADHVYFLEDAVASVITVMSDGGTAEVGMIGSEGLVGLHGLLGARNSPHQVIIHTQGTALRMETARCRLLIEDDAPFRQAVMRFIDRYVYGAGQTAACNRLHSIEQRCARWLLMAADRQQADQMPMTHEFLSAMLGARRAGISETAADLQRHGAISYHHGKLTILDRSGLEGFACECYKSSRLYNRQNP